MLRPTFTARAFALLVCSAALGCVGQPVRHSWDYKKLAVQPTPPEWRSGSVWRFITTPRSGEPEVLTFRVTDRPAKTCTSGEWRKLVLLEGKIGTESESAYTVDGRFLWVSINANICDANDDIRGALVGATFKGDRSAGGIFGSETIGTVAGELVKR